MLALRKLFAPRAAKMTRPPPMSDAEILKQYGDRPINANVQALAHLMLAGAIIETLIEKHIINYGPATSKSAEASDHVRKVALFIDRVTKAHQDGQSKNFGEFRQAIQEQSRETVAKLAAIASASERKLGTPDAELASPVPFSLKVCIATVLENTFRLFGLPNPYLTMCATYASRAGEGERDGITELAKLCKRRLNAGNGSQSHRFLRIAASAIALQCPTAEGISFVRMRVDRSIAQHGTLSNEKFNLDGLPQWEEEYENPDAWFRDVTLTLDADGASVCAFGILALAGFLKVAGKHEVGERLRLTFITSMKGHCGFNDGFRPADRIRDLQNRLVQASELLRSGGEPAALLGGIADTFAAFKDKEASAFVSDRTVKPVEGPLPWVDDALATLAEAKAAVIDNMSKTATPTLTGKGSTIGGRGTVDPTQAAAVDRAFEQGMRLLKVHGFAAIASAQQG